MDPTEEGAQNPQENPLPTQFIATEIPDGAVVSSDMAAIGFPQSVRVDYAELEQYSKFIRENSQLPISEQIKKAAVLTANTLKSGVDKWGAIVSQDRDSEYTLGKCIQENVNSCFHRAVFFNLMMQQAGIPCATVDGRWVESQRNNILTDKPEGSRRVVMGGLNIAQDDKSEEHVWNLVQTEGKVFLVDTAYLAQRPDGKYTPVIYEVAYHPPTDGRWRKPEDRYYRVVLPDGSLRHYGASQMLEVNK